MKTFNIYALNRWGAIVTARRMAGRTPEGATEAAKMNAARVAAKDEDCPTRRDAMAFLRAPEHYALALDEPTGSERTTVTVRTISPDELAIEWHSRHDAKHSLREAVWTLDEVTHGERGGRFYAALIHPDALDKVTDAIARVGYPCNLAYA